MASGRRSQSSDKNSKENEENPLMINLNLVKELLAVQESSMKAFFSTFVESTNKRIDDFISTITKDVADLKNSLEYTQAQVDDIRNYTTKSQIEGIESCLDSLRDKVDDLENRSRRNNLCFEGIEESGRHETWEKSEEIIKDLINDKLKLDADEIQIERAHRIGKPKNNKSRTIIAKFLNYKDRERILKSRRQLKGTSITIREDYSDMVAEKRKNLVPQMLEARRNGKIAYLRHDKLIIHDRSRPPFQQTVPVFSQPGFGRGFGQPFLRGPAPVGAVPLFHPTFITSSQLVPGTIPPEQQEPANTSNNDANGNDENV